VVIGPGGSRSCDRVRGADGLDVPLHRRARAGAALNLPRATQVTLALPPESEVWGRRLAHGFGRESLAASEAFVREIGAALARVPS